MSIPRILATIIVTTTVSTLITVIRSALCNLSSLPYYGGKLYLSIIALTPFQPSYFLFDNLQPSLQPAVFLNDSPGVKTKPKFYKLFSPEVPIGEHSVLPSACLGMCKVENRGRREENVTNFCLKIFLTKRLRISIRGNTKIQDHLSPWSLNISLLEQSLIDLAQTFKVLM